MTKKFCDRCKVETIHILVLRQFNAGTDQTWDLCVDCTTAFKKWVATPP